GRCVAAEVHGIRDGGRVSGRASRRTGDPTAARGRPPVGAFTATATPRVRHDIASSLGLREPVERVTGFVRDNLTMSVMRCRGGADKREALLARIRPGDGRSLVYCGTRKSAEEIASLLRAAGHRVAA